MKLAILHDELMRRGGAEQVALAFHKAYPVAPLYTMAYNQKKTYDEFSECKIHTSWYGNLISGEKWMKRLYYPLGFMAMRSMKVSGYDVVLISTTYAAKCADIAPGTIVFVYCHCPFRLAWYPESYSEYISSSGIVKFIFNIFIRILKGIDYKHSIKYSNYIANSYRMASEIQRIYKLKDLPAVIHPPVDCSKFSIGTSGEFYLIVSRLEYYKMVHLAVEAFNKLGKPLIVVGKGSQEEVLKQRAKSNIIFRSGLSSQQLMELYRNCKAVVFPQLEDYGIVPLEANASGKPVVAFGQGGVLETMIPYDGKNEKKCTSVFFQEQTEDSLSRAIELADEIKFDPVFIRQHAEEFDIAKFNTKIKELVENELSKRSG